MRRRHYAKSKRAFKLLREKMPLHLRRVIKTTSDAFRLTPSAIRTAAQQKSNLSLVLRDATISRQAPVAAPSRTVLRFRSRVRRKKVRKDYFVKLAVGTPRRTIRWNTPALSRVSEVHHLAAVKHATPRKVQGL